MDQALDAIVAALSEAGLTAECFDIYDAVDALQDSFSLPDGILDAASTLLDLETEASYDDLDNTDTSQAQSAAQMLADFLTKVLDEAFGS